MIKPRFKESMGLYKVLSFSEERLAYNKLGRLIGSPVFKAGNKVKDIEIKMKIAHLLDGEETMRKLLLWTGLTPHSTHTKNQWLVGKIMVPKGVHILLPRMSSDDMAKGD